MLVFFRILKFIFIHSDMLHTWIFNLPRELECKGHVGCMVKGKESQLGLIKEANEARNY